MPIRTPAQIAPPDQMAEGLYILAKGRKFGSWVSEGFTFTAATSDICTTSAAHLWENGQTVRLTTTDTLPAGLALATTYYLVSKNSLTFKLSLTRGGAAVDITGTGTGVHTVSRYNGLTTSDAIENAAYVIESILRDELGLTSADINAQSFDQLGNTLDGLRIGWLHARSLTERANSLDYITEIAQEAGLIFLKDHANKARVVALDHYNPSFTLTSADIVSEGNPRRPLFRNRQTHVRHIRNEFRLRYRFDAARQTFLKELFITAADHNLADNTRLDKTPLDTYTGLCTQSQSLYNVVQPWTFEAYGIRADATAEKFIKAMADWLAIRKWEIHATLWLNATTFGIEAFDQAYWNFDLLPVSMRNTSVAGLGATPGTDGAADLADDTYYYRVAAMDKYGEQKACAEVSAVVSGGGGIGKVDLAWTAITGATSYRVFGRTTASQILYEDTATNSFTDMGSASLLGSGSPIEVAPAFFVTRINNPGIKGGGRKELHFIACPTVFF